MLTTQEYEEIYCTYCDSQRCLNRTGLTLSDVCPYWEVRQKEKDENNNTNYDLNMR